MTSTAYELTIPRVFACDREDRDLCNGEGEWNGRGFKTRMTQEQLAELRSDADYYSDSLGFDLEMCPKGLFASARATLRAIERARCIPTA